MIYIIVLITLSVLFAWTASTHYELKIERLESDKRELEVKLKQTEEYYKYCINRIKSMKNIKEDV